MAAYPFTGHRTVAEVRAMSSLDRARAASRAAYAAQTAEGLAYAKAWRERRQSGGQAVMARADRAAELRQARELFLFAQAERIDMREAAAPHGGVALEGRRCAAGCQALRHHRHADRSRGRRRAAARMVAEMIRRHGNDAPRKPRYAPKSLRMAPTALTPQLVGRILDLAATLKAANTTSASESVQLRPVRIPTVKPTIVIEHEPVEPAIVAPIVAPIVAKVAPTPVPTAAPVAAAFTEALKRMAEIERAAVAPAPTKDARLRLGAPASAKRRSAFAHPLERAATGRISYLRGHGVSVSIATTGVHGTSWWVSTYPNPLGAVELIALAERKGFVG